jgi:uncharacterized protein YkwD
MHAQRHLLARLLPVVAAVLLLRSATAQGTGGYDDEVFLRVNQIRQSAGLQLLARNRALDLAAQFHAEDMARNNFMSHSGSNGSNPAARIRAAGYPWINWGENVAVGYSSPSAVMNAWMNSPGHRANILNPNVREIGIGIAQAPGTRWGFFWCQDFGTRSGAVTAPAYDTPEGDDTGGDTPFITDSTPDEGPSGTIVVISGTGFGNGEGGCLLLQGITGSAQIESWTDTRIVVRIFNAQPGSGSIRVCNGNGQTSNPTPFGVQGS